MNWIIVLILFAVIVLLSIIGKVLLMVYKHQYKPRFENKYGIGFYEGEDFNSNQLRTYYCNHTKGLLNRPFFFDAENAFVFKANGIDYYNICGIAEYAILQYDYQFTNQEKFDETKFRGQINWLERNAKTQNDDSVCWEYDFAIGAEKPPFSSGIAQGMAISALLRAYQFYNNTKYLELAEAAFQFMNKPVSEGGKRTGEGAFENWYEEYSYGKHVLNGHIFSLWGVWDLYRVTQNQIYKEWFQKGCDAIKLNINDYDMGFSTRYSNMFPYPANNSYHVFHIVQFDALARITEDVFFINYAQLFKNYFSQPKYRLMCYIYLLKKVIQQKFLKK